MAGNVQADASGDVLVEFDYNNIILVDPNKTIDKYNKVKERLVDHESLVMYVNLEADILPRTKLAVGGAQWRRHRRAPVDRAAGRLPEPRRRDAAHRADRILAFRAGSAWSCRPSAR